MTNPTGEAENDVLRLDFDRRIMVQFRGSVVTSDAGLLAYRELDDALGLTPTAGDLLADARTGKNGRHALVGMFRQSVFGRLAGYEDVNDALRLRHDPAMRWLIGGKATKGTGASPSQMGRFETKWLARPENLAALTDLSGRWIDQVAKSRSRGRVVFDMDSSVSPTHGDQEGSVWNGDFVCTCYHPLFVFNQYGDLERCTVRLGNVHSAEGWEAVLKPVVARGALKGTRLSCRSFNANAVRLQLHALAYNLGNFLRTLVTPEPIAEWSLTTLREKLIKIGAKVVSHGRYVAFQMAEVAIPRLLFAAIVERIAALRSPPVAIPA